MKAGPHREDIPADRGQKEVNNTYKYTPQFKWAWSELNISERLYTLLSKCLLKFQHTNTHFLKLYNSKGSA